MIDFLNSLHTKQLLKLYRFCIPKKWQDKIVKRDLWLGMQIKDEYDFDFILSDPILEPAEKPCHDCAVVCGLYSELTHELSTKPLQYQHDIAIRWDCHNNRSKACRGNIDLLKQLNKE